MLLVLPSGLLWKDLHTSTINNFNNMETIDDAENTTSKSHGPRALLMAPAQQQERT